MFVARTRTAGAEPTVSNKSCAGSSRPSSSSGNVVMSSPLASPAWRGIGLAIDTRAQEQRRLRRIDDMTRTIVGQQRLVIAGPRSRPRCPAHRQSRWPSSVRGSSVSKKILRSRATRRWSRKRTNAHWCGLRRCQRDIAETQVLKVGLRTPSMETVSQARSRRDFGYRRTAIRQMAKLL